MQQHGGRAGRHGGGSPLGDVDGASRGGGRARSRPGRRCAGRSRGRGRDDPRRGTAAACPDPRQDHHPALPDAHGAGLRRTDPRRDPGPGVERRHRPAVQRADSRGLPALLWGDWNRDGAFTPAVYTSGHWVVYDSMIGDAPVVTREFDYGAPGDRPVVGDFNKDGRPVAA